jgi:SpoVK/Ycf46/Vps4 family AAA+-type ATPase
VCFASLHRFDEVIYAGLPDAAEREHILERARSRAAADGAPWHSSVSTAELSARTASYSGADLAGLVRNAAVAALQRGLEREAVAATNSNEAAVSSADSSSVSQADVEMELVLDQACFERALARTSPSSDAAAVLRYMRWAQQWSRRVMPT